MQVAQLALSDAQLDDILARQLAVAWAGEAGDEIPRLGWWATSLDEEFGGRDLFERLAPRTAQWAVFTALREVAARVDAARRDATGDRAEHLHTLFHLGFAVDEQLEDRLRDLTRAGTPPREALPALAQAMGDGSQAFDAQVFASWCAEQGDGAHESTSIGRKVQPGHPHPLTARLVAALAPCPDHYPLPYAAEAE